MVEAVRGRPADAFLVPQAGEFAHLHPGHDGSLHLALPPALAADTITKGWAVAHPLAGIRLARGMVMIYGPRDAAELDIVAGILLTSHAYATGSLLPRHWERHDIPASVSCRSGGRRGDRAAPHGDHGGAAAAND